MSVCLGDRFFVAFCLPQMLSGSSEPFAKCDKKEDGTKL